MPMSAAAGAAICAMAPLEGALEGKVLRLVEACRLGPSAAVAVAGPAAGPAMAVLWRRGFSQVESARRVTCPSADQLSDALLVPGCASVEQACEVVTAVLAILRPGGVLGIDLSGAAGAPERLRVCRMLAHRGLRHRADAHLKAEIIAYKPELAEYFTS